MKKALAIILGLAVLTGGILFSIYGAGGLQRLTADFRGETSQIEQTEANADYRISAYDRFYDKCASVQTIEGKISNLEEELEATEDKQRISTLNTSITASKNKREEMINSYNADASKEDTRAKFKASDLPYELDANEEETVCVD